MTEQELNAVRDLSKQIADLERYVSNLRKRAANITPDLDGMPRRTGVISRVELLALEIVDCEKELEELKGKLVSVGGNLLAHITKHVPDLNQRTVLILRYISCMRFRDISFELDKSDARIYQIHRDALKTLNVEDDYIKATVLLQHDSRLTTAKDV